ncbi:hypothetical protein D3C72_679660 [compost metagenome]
MDGGRLRHHGRGLAGRGLGRVDRRAADRQRDRAHGRARLGVNEPDGGGREAVKGRQVHRHPLGDQVREQAQQGGRIVLAAHADRAGEVGPIAQDRLHHAAAGVARAHLYEDPGAVGIGLLDHAGEVQPMHGLRNDRLGRGLAIDGVGMAQAARVEPHAGRRGGGLQVELAVSELDGLEHLAMDRGDAFERHESRAHVGDERGQRLAIATHHALVRRVDDEQIDPLAAREGGFDLGTGAIDDAQGPVDGRALGQAPGDAGGLAWAGQVAGEERRDGHAA